MPIGRNPRRRNGFVGCREEIQSLRPRQMPSRLLLRVLLLVALVVAPLSMMRGHAAMAMPTSAAESGHQAAMPGSDGHCSDMGDQDGRDMDAAIDCMVACAGMLPQTPAVRDASLVVSAPARAAVAVARHGLNPAAEPPPPRLA